MARTDLYIDCEYYEAMTSKARPVADAEALTDAIAAAQSIVDRELGVVSGAFNEDDSATFVVDAHGGPNLWFRDIGGAAFFVRSAQVGIDTTRAGTFDGVTFDVGDPWCQGIEYYRPLEGDVSYSGLRLLPIGGAPVSSWPDMPFSVRLVGDMGIDGGPPSAIKALMVSVTRELRDHFSAGSAGQQRWGDDDVPLSDNTWRQIARIKSMFSRWLPI